MCAAIYLPHARFRVAQNSILHWSICRTVDDTVDDPLSAKDKLPGWLLTQFPPKLNTKVACATQKKKCTKQILC